MNDANLSLSKRQWAMINDKDIMPEKQDAIHKIALWMKYNIDNLKDYHSKAPLKYKIQRGENLKNQPWIAVDLPQIKLNQPFNHVRLLFWWGQGFYIHYIFSHHQFEILPDYLFNGTYEFISGENLWDQSFEQNDWQVLKSTSQLKTQLETYGWNRIGESLPMEQLNSLQDHLEKWLNIQKKITT